LTLIMSQTGAGNLASLRQEWSVFAQAEEAMGS
jgi:hypothetical protein